MIKSIFYLLKIHWKVIFGNTAIIVQNMLGIAPESFNAINMISAVLVGECLGVVKSVMLAPSAQGIVTPESISIIYRSFPGYAS
mgnify:FL=1